jgi:hypothetical protein
MKSGQTVVWWLYGCQRLSPRLESGDLHERTEPKWSHDGFADPLPVLRGPGPVVAYDLASGRLRRGGPILHDPSSLVPPSRLVRFLNWAARVATARFISSSGSR